MSVNIKVTGGLNIEWGQIDPKVTGGLKDTPMHCFERTVRTFTNTHLENFYFRKICLKNEDEPDRRGGGQSRRVEGERHQIDDSGYQTFSQ